MPPKRQYKKKKKVVRKRQYKKKTSGITMNQMLSKMCITKIHKFAGMGQLHPFGTSVGGIRDSNWYLHFPANLARNNGQTALLDTTYRESSRIHFKNVRYNLQFLPEDKTIRPVQYRFAFGYFKGDDNLGSQQITSTKMNQAFPTVDDNLKRTSPSATPNVPSASDFYMKYVSKVYTITPKQIYDSNGSDDLHGALGAGGALTELPEPMRALWLPKSHTFNFTLNRTLTYEGPDGDSLNGWCPFFAVQSTCIGDTWTCPDVISNITPADWGAKPCPLLKIDSTSYFCDIH